MKERFSISVRNLKLNPFTLSLFGIVFLFALLNWSCSSIIQPVSVKGAETDLALLAGEWEGEYYRLNPGKRRLSLSSPATIFSSLKEFNKREPDSRR